MRRALIISSQKYTHEHIEDLSKCHSDTKEIKRILEDKEGLGFVIERLIDRKSHEIRKAIDHFYSSASPEDILLLYFAGHGKLNLAGEFALLARDTTETTFASTHVEWNFIRNQMNRCRARKHIVILDCCYSGWAHARKDSIKDTIEKPFLDGTDSEYSKLLISSTSKETVAALEKLEKGPTVYESNFSIFAEQLIFGFKHKDARGKSGELSVAGLFNFVKRRVIESSHNTQRPFISQFGDDFVLIEGDDHEHISHKLTEIGVELRSLQARIQKQVINKQVGKSQLASIKKLYEELRYQAFKDDHEHSSSSEATTKEEENAALERFPSLIRLSETATRYYHALRALVIGIFLIPILTTRNLASLLVRYRYLSISSFIVFFLIFYQSSGSGFNTVLEPVLEPVLLRLPWIEHQDSEPRDRLITLAVNLSPQDTKAVLLPENRVLSSVNFIPSGEYTLQLSHPNYEDENITVDLTENLSFDHRMQTLKLYDLTISVAPAEAQILLNQNPIPAGEPQRIASGDYTVSITAEGYFPKTKRVSLLENTEIHTTLIEDKHLQHFSDRLADGSRAPTMVYLKGGTFIKGFQHQDFPQPNDELPQKPVTVTDFAIGKYEVSFNDFEKYSKARGIRRPSDSGWGTQGMPVINVTREEAYAYAQWLTQQTGEQYRLPTESEWEYAARARKTSLFFSGDCLPSSLANFNELAQSKFKADCNRDNRFIGATVSVGSYQPNDFDLHDMYGNVWEWVADCWQSSTHLSDKSEKDPCSIGVIRGGGWRSKVKFLRLSNRGKYEIKRYSDDIGFRLVRDVKRAPDPSQSGWVVK